jgi:hypothetical protein
MKFPHLGILFAALISPVLFAQQFTPPALPPGAKGSGERVESDVLKVYEMQDRGATFRAYVVKYKGNEVVVSDTLARSSKKVGDKIMFVVSRAELPLGTEKLHVLSFQILDFGGLKKP